MSWSARQYSTFENERTRPVRDLLNAVDTGTIKQAIDLGCGPGNSTEVMVGRLHHAVVAGVDNSADMIAAAKVRLPGVRFDLADISTWDDFQRYDLILANAALQWLPDHTTLMPRLVAKLAPQGQLAVQMPDNLDEPAHRLMRQVAADGPWADKLSKAADARAPRLPAEWYYALLKSHTARVDIWRTTYHHVLAGGTDAIVEWFKGSGLRPFLAPLNEAEAEGFLHYYREALVDAYPPLPDGSVLLPFPRLFFVARVS